MTRVRSSRPHRQPSRKFTVREVWRTIVKKNERHGAGIFDVLVCGHAVAVDISTRANTYRRARSCPACRERVQRYADDMAVKAAA